MDHATEVSLLRCCGGGGVSLVRLMSSSCGNGGDPAVKMHCITGHQFFEGSGLRGLFHIAMLIHLFASN